MHRSTLFNPQALILRPVTGHDIPTLLKAILQLLPLDETAPPAMVMGMVGRNTCRSSTP